MDEDNLGHKPIEYFEEFHKQRKLGRIYFPNGQLDDPFADRSERIKPYFIHLEELYQTIDNWTIDNKNALERGLVGIITIGNAVAYPGYVTKDITRKVKKGWFRHEYVTAPENVTIQPTQAEFLIVTRDNPVPLEYISRRTTHIAACETQEDNIKLYTRGIEQVLAGLKRGRNTSIDTDNTTIDAFQNGIPIFFNHELKYITETTGVENYNPGYPEWHLGKNEIRAIIRKC